MISQAPCKIEDELIELKGTICRYFFLNIGSYQTQKAVEQVQACNANFMAELEDGVGRRVASMFQYKERSKAIGFRHVIEWPT